MLMLVMVLLFVYGEHWAEAQVNHVVGEDRGWELASDIGSWVEGRTFIVGDFLWFAYSSGLDKDNIVELKSKDEFESCDVSNPIKMYTNGVDQIALEQEGIRYFTSASSESCKKGLKLPVEIKSKSTAVVRPSSSSSSSSSSLSWTSALAQEPTAPSSSTKIYGSTFMIFVAIIINLMGI